MMLGRNHLVMFAFALGTLVHGQSAESAEGTLNIRIVSSLGATVRVGRLSIYANGTRAYSADVAGETTVRLPYGQYSVDFSSIAWKPVHRQVKVDKPEVLVILGTTREEFPGFLPEMRMEPLIISLRVSPAIACSQGLALWAKLVGVFSDYSAEREIGPLGFTKFDPVDDGTYVVMIVDGERVRSVQSVTTTAKVSVVNLALPECK
jgi:hypothetical protein